MDRSWIVEIYRVGSLTTIRLERVKHAWLDALATVLTVAQYDDGVAGSHHYLVYPMTLVDWYRLSRTCPSAGVHS